MNTITKFLSISAFAIGIVAPLSSVAQSTMEHSKMASIQTPSMTDGEIKKVDPLNGKVTIKHGDIKHLDMPGMTMVFTVRDKGLLATVKPGDKIKFMAVSEGGKLIVTDIQPIR